MRLRILALSLVGVMILALAAVGTFAIFSSQTSNTGNTFTAGTLAISVDNPGTWSVLYDEMAPGDTVAKEITLKNTGTLELEFVTVPTRSGALFEGAHRATVTISSGTGMLAPGATQDVMVEVTLPLAADNAYQGATGTLDLLFTAFQIRNISTETATINFMGTSGPWDIYRFYDGDGNLLIMNDANILAFTEIRPDGSVISLALDSSSDPNFYFRNGRPAGTYRYEIMGKNGVKYIGTIVRP